MLAVGPAWTGVRSGKPFRGVYAQVSADVDDSSVAE